MENQATSTACFEPQACNNVQNVPLVFVLSTQQTFLARNGLHKLKQLLILQNSPLTTVRVHLQQRKQKYRQALETHPSALINVTVWGIDDML